MSPNEAIISDADISAKMKLLSESVSSKTFKADDSKPFKRELVWKNVAVYVIGHALGVWGMYLSAFHIPYIHTFCCSLLGIFFSCVGVQAGAHRFYTHKAFKASKALQVVMILAQTASSQNCMWVWVRDHRQHHKYSDTDADPHNANNGFFFSHVGWLLTRKHPDVIAKGKGIDMSDLDADPIVQFQKKHYTILWFLLAILLPVMIPVYALGYPWWKAALTWGALRIVLGLNLTWLVNSWAHLIGSRPFDKNILPVETHYIPWALMGEGWHNYHHTFPWDYNASEYGAPYNLPGYFIRWCARQGWAWDLKAANGEVIYTRAEKTGDGTPYLEKLKYNHTGEIKTELTPRTVNSRVLTKAGMGIPRKRPLHIENFKFFAMSLPYRYYAGSFLMLCEESNAAANGIIFIV